METLFNCSLWGDEAFSAVAAQKPFLEMMGIVFRDTSPPLFYIISFLWFRIFGSSEIAIRSLSLLFYLGTTIVVFFLVKELFKEKKEAFLAAFLTFFNPFLFPYAFEGRMYFSLLFFVVLSFYFLIKKSQWGYILSASAALYCHHFSFFALLAQFVWQLIKKKNLWKAIKPYLIIALIYSLWLYPFYLQTKMVAGGFWLGKPKLKDLLGIFTNFLKTKAVLEVNLIALLVLFLRKWQKGKILPDLLLILWALLPPGITFLISQTKLSIFYERYLLYSVPPLMILLATKLRKASHLPLLGILVLYAAASWQQFNQPFKRPFRQLSQWIKENVSEETFLVNYNGASHHLWETKYYQIKAPIYAPGGKLPFYVGTAQMTEEDVINQLPENQKIALISSDHPDLIKINGRQIESFENFDNSLYFVWLKER